ncbi:MAG: hypothetical protein WD426_15130 [Anditalea sp.]
MNKKTYILSFLLLAYSVMLAHAFIPHQHQENLSETEHHHEQGQPHHHPENGDDKDNDSKFPLFHVHHSGNGTTEEYISHSANNCFVKINKSSLLIPTLNIVIFNGTEVPKLRHPDFLGLLVLSDQFQSSITLRGPPPAFIISKA